MLIRPIEEKDNKVIADIVRSCLSEYGAAAKPGTAWFDPDLERFSYIYSANDRIYLVGEDDEGKVVAGAGIGPLENGICELQKMYCLPDYRGTGLSQELLRRVLDFASLNYESCYLETLDNMDRAKAFYRRNGFLETDITLGNTGHDGCPCHFLKIFRK